MNWDNITVKQYQEIYQVLADNDKTELDVVVECISICEGSAIDDIDSWPAKKLFDKQKEYSFLFDLKPSNPKSFIEANGKRYHFVHEVEKMPAARYIESKHFTQNGVIENLHTIMASCVVPMKKKMWVWIDDKYDARNHSQYAADLLQAKFIDVYNCVVFFCQLYGGWTILSRDYLVKAYSQIMTESQALTLVESLTESMAGYITPKQLQILNGLRLKQPTNSRQ